MTALAPDILYFTAQAGAQRLLDSLVLGSEIAACAWLLLRLVPRPSPAARFAVWFSALVAMGLLPVGVGALAPPAVAAPGALPPTWRIALPASWALYLFAAWALIAACGVLRLASGLWQLRSLRGSCSEIDPASLPPLARNTVATFRSPTKLRVCQSDRINVPTALGFFQPAVVLPSWLLPQVSPEELNQILLHEIAHLRRHDDWTNLAQKLLQAILFFHPAAWWIGDKISLAREMACDDAVLRVTASPRSYARCLARLAEASFIRRSVALGQAAVSRLRQTSRRVSYILDASPRAASRAWQTATPLLAILLLASIAMAVRSPRLLAFQAAATPDLPLRASSTPPPLPLVRASYALEARPAPVPRPVHAMSLRGHARHQSRSISPLTASGTAAVLHLPLSAFNPSPRLMRAGASAGPDPDWHAARLVIVTLVDRQWTPVGPQVWLVRVWQVTLLDPLAKPLSRQISQKTI